MLWSNDNSYVFAYIVGNGAQNLLSMPDGDIVTAETLMESLFLMNLKKLYKNLVIFADTPNAAGLFAMYDSEYSLKELNVLAIAASGYNET